MAIQFKSTDAFQKILLQRVNEYFKNNNVGKYANGAMIVKLVCIAALWIVSIVAIFNIKTTFSGYVFLYMLHGLCSILVIFNISHDAVHHALFRNKFANNILGYSFNVLGGNKYSWYLKHNIGHHNFTNIHGKDIDIETAPLFRISPYTPLKKHYRFQHLYILPLYCFLSLALILVIDFVVMFKIKPGGKKPAVKEWMILFCSKFIYLGYIILAPAYFLQLTLFEVIICFFVMHAVIGFFISLVLLSSHFIEHASYYKVVADSKLSSSWPEHQLLTTIDIAPENKMANLLLGGLNANIIHHILPGICHIHFIPLSKILKHTAEEYNMPYIAFTFKQALKEHFIFLKKMGR
jgi:linoleoyl-CoA desaturase